MKKINVSIEDKTIEIFNETNQTWEKCNFEEAGFIYPDKYSIAEYLADEFPKVCINWVDCPKR